MIILQTKTISKLHDLIDSPVCHFNTVAIRRLDTIGIASLIGFLQRRDFSTSSRFRNCRRERRSPSLFRLPGFSLLGLRLRWRWRWCSLFLESGGFWFNRCLSRSWYSGSSFYFGCGGRGRNGIKKTQTIGFGWEALENFIHEGRSHIENLKEWKSHYSHYH